MTDLFGVCAGVAESFSILRKIRPDVVFSKGGYVALPVVVAAWALRIPIIIHESDVSLGLANRISAKFARLICVTHEETKSKFRHPEKVVATGLPLRQQIFFGDKIKGLDMCGFDNKTPVVLILGGGVGSKQLNDVVEQALPALLKRFQIVHITGKGKQLQNERSRYRQFEFVDAIEHLYACADLIVGRAGATTVAEIIALKKPNILIPLQVTASRGDQIENALMCERRGLSCVIKDRELSELTLNEAIARVFNNETNCDKKSLPPQIDRSVCNQICDLIVAIANQNIRNYS